MRSPQGGKDTGFISQRTGIVTTSAGLLFHAGGDGKLRVYDSDSGRVLWTGKMPAGSRGIPAMYEVNGRQFFVVNATSSIVRVRMRRSANAAPQPARAYVAFALQREDRAPNDVRKSGPAGNAVFCETRSATS